MADKLTKEQRHRCMSAIKSKNTTPEIVVRKFLFSRGFRYRLNHPRLPGHPDLVLRKYRTVMVAFGMVMKTVNTFICPKPTLIFGQIK